MYLKKIIFIFISTLFIKNVSCMNFPYDKGKLPPPPSPEEIEEIMKSPEFKQMMGELEKIFEETDEEEESDEKIPKKAKPSLDKTSDITKKTKPIKPETRKNQFLKPVEEKTKKDELIKKLPPKKIEAFYYYINKFKKSIENIEKNINSFALGIAFKEYMENKKFNSTVNSIIISINQIKSKKLYLKIFFLPSNTNLRKDIIDALKISRKLERKILDKKDTEKKEKETVEFIKKMAKSSKDISKLKLNPLQKKLQKFLNTNLKEISEKITKIAISAQAKEEIEKKKKYRKKLAKDALKKQKYRSSRSPYYNTPYYGTPTWPTYGRKQKSYSGPKNWRNYPGAYNPKISKPAEKKTSIKPDKTTKDKTRDRGRLSDKTVQKLNLIKNLSKDIQDSLKQVKEKYNPGNEEKSFDSIYKSKLLSKITNDLEKIKKAQSHLSKKAQKDYSDSNLKKSITEFIPLGIKLAKNPSSPNQKEEKNAAQNIINYEPKVTKENLKKYEEEKFKELIGKEKFLTDLSASQKDLRNIQKNLAILNTGPQVNIEKISSINDFFRKESQKAKNMWENIPLKKLNEISENIGEFETKTIDPEKYINLSTGDSINNIIDEFKIPNEIKSLFKNKINKLIDKKNMDKILTEKQKENIQKEFKKIIENISEKQKFIENIEKYISSIEEKTEKQEKPSLQMYPPQIKPKLKESKLSQEDQPSTKQIKNLSKKEQTLEVEKKEELEREYAKSISKKAIEGAISKRLKKEI
ncbi:hypothetical protein GF385_04550, partial [Candidatus Dependentiae bacterium]|nr:hypothetical protein [Candidatus Dependentiae bacterium]